MSQNPYAQQPNQPPQQPDQNPYAQQPPQPGGNPYGQPPQQPPQPGGNPFGQQPQQPPYGAPGGFPPPPPAPSGKVGLAIVAGVVAMLVGAGIYGGVFKASDGGQVGYLAAGVGALIGAALGKIGGRNPILVFVGILLGLIGVYLGQIFGFTLVLMDYLHISVVEALTEYFDDISKAWQDNFEAIDLLFYVLSGAAVFSAAKKLAN
ncbi:hypothetical protein [Streptomyces sp. H27-D2]|uniref:hypothetical protein n=1 Tax=Streptomyces sp. H27-D2 TaxID=3046304 RepID=UPI002DC03DDE|nr:hypothetical protein [Streptomyces sp. H27-D2]MEC4017453.1 hypothetical protein [Streptomyces sp. H27-D2]